MSNGYATPLRLDLQPSAWIRRLISFSHGAALLSLPFPEIPLWLKILLAVVLLVSLVINYRTHVYRRGRRSVRRMTWLTGAEWHIEDGEGQCHHAVLLADAYVNPRLVIVPLRVAGQGVRHIPMLADMLEPECFRQLRVRLKLHVTDDQAQA